MAKNSPSSRKQKYLQIGLRYRKSAVLLARVVMLAKISASCRLRFSANKKTTRRRRKPNGGIFSLCGIFKGTHIIKCRKFTLSSKAKVFANRGALRKSVVLLARVIITNIKPQTHGKSQRSEIFVNKGGGAEAEASNARQGIAKNRPRAQPLKAWFSDAQLIILIIKPQTHGKSQRSEIFVNKVTPLRGSERSECTASTAV